jgi:hypothetical protein
MDVDRKPPATQEPRRTTPVSRKRHQARVTRGTEATSDKSASSTLFDAVLKAVSFFSSPVSSVAFIMKGHLGNWIPHLLFFFHCSELMYRHVICQYHLEPLLPFSAATLKSSHSVISEFELLHFILCRCRYSVAFDLIPLRV